MFIDPQDGGLKHEEETQTEKEFQLLQEELRREQDFDEEVMFIDPQDGGLKHEEELKQRKNFNYFRRN